MRFKRKDMVCSTSITKWICRERQKWPLPYLYRSNNKLGEDIDDFVVRTKSKTDQTIRNLTKTALNPEGVSVLDDNGNLRSTYDILLDISRVYKQIQEDDKLNGTNRLNGPVYMATYITKDSFYRWISWRG